MSAGVLYMDDDTPSRGSSVHRPESVHVASYYFNVALEPKKLKTIARSVLKNELATKQFDSIVGTGVSGILPLYTVSEMWKTHFGFVRKPDDNSHSRKPFEGNFGRNWIFVDDFVSGGGTFVRTWKAVNEMAKTNKIDHQCVGAFCYAPSSRPQKFFTLDELVYDFGQIRDLGWGTTDRAIEFRRQLQAEKAA